MTQIDHTQKLLQQALPQYRPYQIDSVLELLADGNTVPFIARYRKERTGSLDEVQIREIEERYTYLTNLENRKEDVLRSIEEQGKLTDDLRQAIINADKLQRVEDLYRPYKQKKRTKATIAKEQGLEPLAEWLLSGDESTSIEEQAMNFLSEEIETVEQALQGAHEIIAERVSDEPTFRSYVRKYTKKNGLVISTDKKKELDEKNVYEMYYAFSQKLDSLQPHRILAMNRGEKEGVLKVTIEVESDIIVRTIAAKVIPNIEAASATLIRAAVEDSYNRFIAPAIERELRNELTELAEEQAIQVFGENLTHLLLQPPLKGKIILGLDPAYRTGCKLAVIDETGKLLETAVIYPHPPASPANRAESPVVFKKLIEKHHVEMIAIGNGTASRESEQFVAEVIKQMTQPLYYAIVNEAGASVYSASDAAREEFPNLQVEERSAISIARRLQDALAELVKIDPQSVGVGQYQHDVSQKKLKDQLEFVVETAVNQVGVNVNTASAALLTHISGLNKTIATNIVRYREENGPFDSRMALKKVPRLGPKAFEQAAGFLRIPNGKNPLDNTEIHPEVYSEAKKVLKLAKVKESSIGTEESKVALKTLTPEVVKEETGLGLETASDVLDSLQKPGRDLRDEIQQPLLRTDVLTMEDLKVGMELQGTVRNVVDFGAFVDIGVKQDGMVHISKLANKFVKHPSEVVKVGDIVTVWLESVDAKRGRIALSMLNPSE